MPALLLTPPRARADITIVPSRLGEASREKFLALLGEQGVREDKDTRMAHAARRTAADRLKLRAGLVTDVPDAVLVPRNRDDVLAILRICAEDGIAVRVVSMPCTEAFDRQDATRRASVLPHRLPRVAIEAGVGDGWRKYVGIDGAVVSIDRFGESAPAKALFKYFGITAEHVVSAVRAVLN